jgi:hypothetical protein
LYFIFVGLVYGLAFCAADGNTASTQSMTINYSLTSRAKLSITPTTINFADSDPTSVPLISANENPVQVTVKIRKDPSAAIAATLVCQGGPLVSGGNTIPSSNISWTATGTGLVAGTLSNSTPQTVGSWTAAGNYIGSLNFKLANLWTYSIGSYTGSILYTLTAP